MSISIATQADDVIVESPARSAIGARWKTATNLAAGLLITAIILWIAIPLGLDVRRWYWDNTADCHYFSDMENRWTWATFAGNVGLYNTYDIIDQSARSNGYHQGPDYGLDYAPLRLMLMTHWAQWVQENYPSAGPRDTRYEVSEPLLRFNYYIELFGALGIFLLVRNWMRQSHRQSLNPAPSRLRSAVDWLLRRPASDHAPSLLPSTSMDIFHGWWHGLAAAMIFWFNPAIIASAHGWPTWDMWVIPFFIWAVYFAQTSHWFLSGAILGIGALMKGQLLFVMPMFILWPLIQLRFKSMFAWLGGVAVSLSAIVAPWMLTYQPNLAAKLRGQDLYSIQGNTTFAKSLAGQRLVNTDAIHWIVGLAVAALLANLAWMCLRPRLTGGILSFFGRFGRSARTSHASQSAGPIDASDNNALPAAGSSLTYAANTSRTHSLDAPASSIRMASFAANASSAGSADPQSLEYQTPATPRTHLQTTLSILAAWWRLVAMVTLSVAVFFALRITLNSQGQNPSGKPIVATLTAGLNDCLRDLNQPSPASSNTFSRQRQSFVTTPTPAKPPIQFTAAQVTTWTPILLTLALLLSAGVIWLFSPLLQFTWLNWLTHRSNRALSTTGSLLQYLLTGSRGRIVMILSVAGFAALSSIYLLSASNAWASIGWFFGLRHYPNMITGTPDNLAAILIRQFDWGNPYELVTILKPYEWWIWPSERYPLTIGQFLKILTMTLLVISSIGVAIQHKRKDPRFLVAVCTPWMIFFAFPAQVHERYLIFCAASAAIWVGMSWGMALLGVGLTILTYLMTMQIMLGTSMRSGPGTTFGSGFSSDTATWLNSLADRLHPNAGYAVIAIALIMLWLCFARSPRLSKSL